MKCRELRPEGKGHSRTVRRPESAPKRTSSDPRETRKAHSKTLPGGSNSKGLSPEETQRKRRNLNTELKNEGLVNRSKTKWGKETTCHDGRKHGRKKSKLDITKTGIPLILVKGDGMANDKTDS